MAETETASSTTAKPAREKGTFVPLIFGGAVACAFGFFAGQLDSVEKYLGWDTAEPTFAADIAAQSEKISEQSAALADLNTRVDGINVEPPAPVDLSPVMAKLDAQSDQIATLTSRLTELEKKPMTEALSSDAIAAYEAELAKLQSSISDQRAEVEALLDQARATETDAAAEAQRALGRAALAKILAAVDAGTPFPDAVADLESSGAADVPAELAAVASSGTPTLAQLQDAFPAASRTALSVARANAPDSNTVGGFLKRQLGARSVAPR